MVTLKDIEITYDSEEKHRNKKIYVEVNNELKEIIWVSDIGERIILHTR